MFCIFACTCILAFIQYTQKCQRLNIGHLNCILRLQGTFGCLGEIRDTNISRVFKGDLSSYEECLIWIWQGKYLGRKKALLNLEKVLLRRVELVRFVRLYRELDFQRALYVLEPSYSKPVIFMSKDQTIYEKLSARKY